MQAGLVAKRLKFREILTAREVMVVFAVILIDIETRLNDIRYIGLAA